MPSRWAWVGHKGSFEAMSALPPLMTENQEQRLPTSNNALLTPFIAEQQTGEEPYCTLLPIQRPRGMPLCIQLRAVVYPIAEPPCRGA